MYELLRLILELTLGIVLPALLVLWDERHLGEESLLRAWPPASYWCAVVTFGFLCLPVHFWRTRRSIRGLGQGILWLLAVVTLQAGLGRLLGA